MNWYGNFEKPIVYTYFHTDVTNLHDLVIIIVMLKCNLVNFFIKTFLHNDPTFQKLKAFEPLINVNLKFVGYDEKFKLKRAYHSP